MLQYGYLQVVINQLENSTLVGVAVPVIFNICNEFGLSPPFLTPDLIPDHSRTGSTTSIPNQSHATLVWSSGR